MRAIAIAVCLCGSVANADPPFGDPNQPYDRLPGTYKTYHVPWAKPLNGDALKALFIVPYINSREVVEVAQRIELDYTVIMNTGPGGWADGFAEGDNATPLQGVAAEETLDRLARERLSLDKQYDVIVIGKISWAVMPAWVKAAILAHVQRGTGLVYVSPNRLQRGQRPNVEVAGEDAEFARLFEADAADELVDRVFDALPMDALPLDLETDPAAARGDSPDGNRWRAERARVRLSSSQHGEGQILGLDFHDEMVAYRNSSSLTPYVYDPEGDHDVVLYDFYHLLLARCMLWTVNRLPQQPDGASEIPATIPRLDTVNFAHAVRDRAGNLVKHRPLPRGEYFIDQGLGSRRLRVETDQRVTHIQLHAQDGGYQGWIDGAGEVDGTFTASGLLAAGQSVRVEAIDTWGRVVAKGKVEANRDQFTLDVVNPLSELWDIHVVIEDEHGVVDRKSTPLVIRNTVFDDFLFMLIFAPTPGQDGWKGQLHAKRMAEFGINATYTYLIYSRHEQFYHNARANLRNVVYAAHLGEILTSADRNPDLSVERTDRDLAELSRMCRRVAETGRRLDPADFPYKMAYVDAGFINARFEDCRRAARFGSPYYTVTGENYLSGEFKGLENSGFGKETTQRFQAWCKSEFNNDLAALNAEWKTNYEAWDQVRGILIQDAVEQDQLPRWIAFRYFMRSRVWSQFFIDYTDMMRAAIPGAKTGRVGHDHHDFTRYREHMTSSKLYFGQSPRPEWRDAIVAELPQSFSNDRGYYLAPQSTLRWHYDLQTEVNRQRWPWLTLIMGMSGFDWERGLSAPTLGGESTFTPCYSEVLPFFRDISDEVLKIQRGVGKLTIASKPHRSDVAILWSPRNHYLSRCLPFEENGFSGTYLSNITASGGAPADCLALMNSLRIRPTFIAPEDLGKRGFKTLILPYNKAMSPAEAEAIRQFVNDGGLVIADNEPGSFTQHGRPLGKRRRLATLFPDFTTTTIVKHGAGRAAYIPNGFNHFVKNLEAGKFSQAEPVRKLLAEFAGQRPPIELLDESGKPRHDVFARLFEADEGTRLYGLLRAAIDDGSQHQITTMVLPEPAHVWDVRTHKYLGHGDRFELSLDLRPRFFAILRSNPGRMDLRGDPLEAKAIRGRALKVSGEVKDAAGVQSIHVRVYDSAGTELRWFRRNEIFHSNRFELSFPLSHSIKPGIYEIRAEHALTGAKATVKFTISE